MRKGSDGGRVHSGQTSMMLSPENNLMACAFPSLVHFLYSFIPFFHFLPISYRHWPVK